MPTRPHDSVGHPHRRRDRAAAGLLGALVALTAGCGGPPEGSAAERALAARVGGVWDVTFRLQRTPRGDTPADAPPARGVVALLETRGVAGRAWLHTAATHDGVYDVDFRPFGFVPELAGPVPVLVAGLVAPDTLVAVTPEGSAGGMLVVRGRVAPGADSVSGTWSYATRAVGGWGGTVTLRRRPPGRH